MGVSSGVVMDWSVVLGASFTGVMVSETVAGAEVAWPSDTVKVMLSVPK